MTPEKREHAKARDRARIAGESPEHRERRLAQLRAHRLANPLTPQQKARRADLQRARLATPEGRAKHVASAYKVDPAAIVAILVLQDERCGICGTALVWPDTHTHIDHCHNTGEVRGLLCHVCNTREPWARQHAKALWAYLESPPAAAILGLA